MTQVGFRNRVNERALGPELYDEKYDAGEKSGKPQAQSHGCRCRNHGSPGEAELKGLAHEKIDGLGNQNDQEEKPKIAAQHAKGTI